MTHRAIDPLTPAIRLSFSVSETVTATRRFVLRGLRQPDSIVIGMITPLFFVVLFGYIFGSSISVPGGHYRSYLMSGLVAVGPLFSAGAVAVAVATDMREGVIDRFKTMPIARSSVLLGRSIATSIVGLPSAAVMIGCAFAVGLRPTRGVGDTLAGFSLVMFFGWAMNWVGGTIGVYTRTVEAANALSTLPALVLGFCSNVYVDPARMPAWLRVVADWNPASSVVAAVRELFGTAYVKQPAGSWPLQHPIITTIVMTSVLLVTMVPLSVRRYSRIGR